MLNQQCFERTKSKRNWSWEKSRVKWKTVFNVTNKI